jgi:hypothetical protein
MPNWHMLFWLGLPIAQRFLSWYLVSVNAVALIMYKTAYKSMGGI